MLAVVDSVAFVDSKFPLDGREDKGGSDDEGSGAGGGGLEIAAFKWPHKRRLFSTSSICSTCTKQVASSSGGKLVRKEFIVVVGGMSFGELALALGLNELEGGFRVQ